jgi:hypothetical protein
MGGLCNRQLRRDRQIFEFKVPKNQPMASPIPDNVPAYAGIDLDETTNLSACKLEHSSCRNRKHLSIPNSGTSKVKMLAEKFEKVVNSEICDTNRNKPMRRDIGGQTIVQAMTNKFETLSKLENKHAPYTSKYHRCSQNNTLLSATEARSCIESPIESAVEANELENAGVQQDLTKIELNTIVPMPETEMKHYTPDTTAVNTKVFVESSQTAAVNHSCESFISYVTEVEKEQTFNTSKRISQ